MTEREPGADRSRWARLVWLASWLAPTAFWAALLLFGAFIVWPQFRGLGSRAELHAWAISLCVLVALVAHALVMHHGTTAPHFSHDEKAELRWKLRTGRGHAHWRALMKRKQATWYKGRSHSGERPRYD